MLAQGEKEVRFFFARLIAAREHQNTDTGNPVGWVPAGWVLMGMSKEFPLTHDHIQVVWRAGFFNRKF